MLRYLTREPSVVAKFFIFDGEIRVNAAHYILLDKDHI